MKTVTTVLSIGMLLTCSAWASVNPIISRDNTRAVIVVSDDSGGKDARKFYDALTVSPISAGSVLQKKITSEDGAFSLLCNYSPAVSLASCTFQVLKIPGSLIMNEERLVKYSTQDAAAAKLRPLFINNLSGGFRYSASNSRIDLVGSDDYFNFTYWGK